MPTVGEWLQLVTSTATAATLLGSIRLPSALKRPPKVPAITEAAIALPGPTAADAARPHFTARFENTSERPWAIRHVEVFSVDGHRLAVGAATTWVPREQSIDVEVVLDLALIEGTHASSAPAGARGYSSMRIAFSDLKNVLARVEVHLVAEHEGEHAHGVYSLPPLHNFANPSDAIVAAYMLQKQHSIPLDHARAQLSNEPPVSPHDPRSQLVVKVGDEDPMEVLRSWAPQSKRALEEVLKKSESGS